MTNERKIMTLSALSGRLWGEEESSIVKLHILMVSLYRALRTHLTLKVRRNYGHFFFFFSTFSVPLLNGAAANPSQ